MLKSYTHFQLYIRNSIEKKDIKRSFLNAFLLLSKLEFITYIVCAKKSDFNVCADKVFKKLYIYINIVVELKSPT